MTLKQRTLIAKNITIKWPPHTVEHLVQQRQNRIYSYIELPTPACQTIAHLDLGTYKARIEGWALGFIKRKVVGLIRTCVCDDFLECTSSMMRVCNLRPGGGGRNLAESHRMYYSSYIVGKACGDYLFWEKGCYVHTLR